MCIGKQDSGCGVELYACSAGLPEDSLLDTDEYVINMTHAEKNITHSLLNVKYFR